MDEKIIEINEIQQIELKMARAVSDILTKNNIYFTFSHGSALGAVRHDGPIPWDFDMDIYIQFEDMRRVIELLRDTLPEPFAVDYYDVNPKYRLFFPRVTLKNSASDMVHVDLFTVFGLPNEERERLAHWKKIEKLNYIYFHYKRESYYVWNNGVKWKYAIRFCMAKTVEFFFLPVSDKYLRNRLTKLFSEYPVADSEFVGAYPIEPHDVFEKRLIMPTVLHKYDDFAMRIPQEYDLYLKHFYGDYMTFPPREVIEHRYTLSAKVSQSDYNILFANK